MATLARALVIRPTAGVEQLLSAIDRRILRIGAVLVRIEQVPPRGDDGLARQILRIPVTTIDVETADLTIEGLRREEPLFESDDLARHRGIERRGALGVALGRRVGLGRERGLQRVAADSSIPHD